MKFKVISSTSRELYKDKLKKQQKQNNSFYQDNYQALNLLYQRKIKEQTKDKSY